MTNRFHKNIRMKDWDYSQSAVYMVTVCVSDREPRLGTISGEDQVNLNAAGKMVQQEIFAIQDQHLQSVILALVVMPNHIHMLIGLNLEPPATMAVSLIDIIGEFKSRTTNRYINGVKMGLLPSFNQKLWQEGYFETVMRDERMTEERRQYIINNPANWRDDKEMVR